MTLNQIFNNIQYGEDFTKKQIFKEEIEKCYDSSLDIFYASKRCKELSGKTVMTESEEMKTNRIISKLIAIEDRLETGKLMSEAYRKMQTAAIIEDCKELQREITKTRKVDSNKLETFGKILATAKYFVESNLDDRAVLEASSNPLLNKIISEEVSGIYEII